MLRSSAESAHSIHGVPGRLLPAVVWPNDPKVIERARGRIASQTWVSAKRPCPSYGARAQIQVSIRFDDNCKNGHETFAITAEIANPGGHDQDILACGCCHEEIAEAFPELAPLIQWHLTSADSPMHYIANAVYLAGDRDHWGKRAGDVSRSETVLQFDAVPIRHRIPRGLEAFLREVATYDPQGREAALTPIAVAHVNKPGDSYSFGPKYQFAGQPPLKWHECAFDTEEEAQRFGDAFANHNPTFHTLPTAWSEGKARELDAARSVAVWPDATDAELMQEPDALRAALEARLPSLQAGFRAAMDGAGFAWDASELKG